MSKSKDAEKVAAVSQKLGQAMYANAQAESDGAGPAGAAGSDGARPDDDVVDAEIVDDEKADKGQGGAA